MIGHPIQITIMIYIFIFQAESPSSGKFTAIAFYLLASLLFLVCSFIESIFVLHLHQSNETQLMLQHSIAKWKLTTRRAVENKQENNQREETNNYIYQVVNIQKIDIAAFVVSGLLFLIFNVIYWITFLVYNID